MTTTYTSYRLVSQDMTRSIERVSQEPLVERDTEYYLANISKIKNIDDFMADTRIFNYAMKAHGLEDMTYAKAFIRKALSEGVDEADAFANKLSDTRYVDFVKTFNFASQGEVATVFTKAQQGTVDKYMRQTLEETAGEENTGVRLALYFERMASTVTSGYGIIADTAIYDVVRTALGLPAEFANSNIDRQSDYLESRIDFADFSDPEKLAKFIERFTALWELDNPSSGSIDVTQLFSSSSDTGISADLLMSINALKLGGS